MRQLRRVSIVCKHLLLGDAFPATLSFFEVKRKKTFKVSTKFLNSILKEGVCACVFGGYGGREGLEGQHRC